MTLDIGMGSLAYLKIGDTDISEYVEDSNFDMNRATDDINTYGLQWAYRLAGIISGSLNAACVYDPALDAVVWAASTSSTEVAWEFGPQGSGEGSVKYSGNMFIESAGISAPSQRAVRQNFSCVINGEISRGAFSA